MLEKKTIPAPGQGVRKLKLVDIAPKCEIYINEDIYSLSELAKGKKVADIGCGYLRREISAIVDDLAFSQNVMTEENEIIELLDLIQGFDPPGVGARDLRECLLLQLERKTQTKHIKLAINIIENYFDEFTKKHYDKLARHLKVEDDVLKPVIAEITKLNPKPGGSAKEDGSNLYQYIIPDFTIVNSNGDLELKLNSRNAPELRVSRDFRDMMVDYKNSSSKN